MQTSDKDEIGLIQDEFYKGINNSHRGINEINRWLKKERFTWQSLTKDAKNLIQNCDTCQRTKT